jgi:hypothetical protein
MSFDKRKGKHRNKAWILIKEEKLRLFNFPQIAKENEALSNNPSKDFFKIFLSVQYLVD